MYLRIFSILNRQQIVKSIRGRKSSLKDLSERQLLFTLVKNSALISLFLEHVNVPRSLSAS